MIKDLLINFSITADDFTDKENNCQTKGFKKPVVPSSDLSERGIFLF